MEVFVGGSQHHRCKTSMNYELLDHPKAIIKLDTHVAYYIWATQPSLEVYKDVIVLALLGNQESCVKHDISVNL